ncbi:hypothetical protein RCL_jg21384.t1 [Rhizophagus clarus]|uniref:Uncharacterized protein n=1 Tax=Rhizophagus clarus TaxID=94130 RepID=A0A8H3LRN4_9GLOM|nr:hypothetical protein RCL_jg21384.t1 [Rhizophagus clarus]
MKVIRDLEIGRSTVSPNISLSSCSWIIVSDHTEHEYYIWNTFIKIFLSGEQIRTVLASESCGFSPSAMYHTFGTPITVV